MPNEREGHRERRQEEAQKSYSTFMVVHKVKLQGSRMAGRTEAAEKPEWPATSVSCISYLEVGFSTIRARGTLSPASCSPGFTASFSAVALQ